MKRLLLPCLVPLLACALGSCLMPLTCFDQCEHQRQDCVDGVDEPGQQVTCESGYEHCTSQCPP